MGKRICANHRKNKRELWKPTTRSRRRNWSKPRGEASLESASHSALQSNLQKRQIWARNRRVHPTKQKLLRVHRRFENNLIHFYLEPRHHRDNFERAPSTSRQRTPNQGGQVQVEIHLNHERPRKCDAGQQNVSANFLSRRQKSKCRIHESFWR